MLKQRDRIEWAGGKPTQPGSYLGELGTTVFHIKIKTPAVETREQPWIVTGSVCPKASESADFSQLGVDIRGDSGGVQRAVSCFRNELDRLVALDFEARKDDPPPRPFLGFGK